jgi:hypothetical protein
MRVDFKIGDRFQAPCVHSQYIIPFCEEKIGKITFQGSIMIRALKEEDDFIIGFAFVKIIRVNGIISNKIIAFRQIVIEFRAGVFLSLLFVLMINRFAIKNTLLENSV